MGVRSIVQLPSTPLSPRKEEIRRWFDATASQRAKWRQRAAFFRNANLLFSPRIIAAAHGVVCVFAHQSALNWMQ
jgi:hypothetical protein